MFSNIYTHELNRIARIFEELPVDGGRHVRPETSPCHYMYAAPPCRTDETCNDHSWGPDLPPSHVFYRRREDPAKRPTVVDGETAVDPGRNPSKCSRRQIARLLTAAACSRPRRYKQQHDVESSSAGLCGYFNTVVSNSSGSASNTRVLNFFLGSCTPLRHGPPNENSRCFFDYVSIFIKKKRRCFYRYFIMRKISREKMF